MSNPVQSTAIHPHLGQIAGVEAKVTAAVTSGRLVVIASDVDSTLAIGAGHTPQQIEEGQRHMKVLVRETTEAGILTIAVTGSHFESGTATTPSVKDRVTNGTLPALATKGAWGPSVDAYVTDGGARLIHADGLGDPKDHQEYGATIERSKFPYDPMLARATRFMFRVNGVRLSADEAALIREYDPLFKGDRIHFQPGTVALQHELAGKIAFHFYAASAAQRDAIEAEAKRAFDGAKIVCGEEKDATTAARGMPHLAQDLASGACPLKYNLDIVPFNKGTAVEVLMGWVSEAVATEALNQGRPRPEMLVVACGDAGNDMPLMDRPEVTHVVMVGGASKELLRHADYLRQSGKVVYVETEPDRLGPASIRAALAEWGLTRSA
ncbi:MAG: HAD family hydrolase [Bdellovibrionota bacterium]|nr:MAG: HAD family hydrolase [Bdellovibrionota bacterium]